MSKTSAGTAKGKSRGKGKGKDAAAGVCDNSDNGNGNGNRDSSEPASTAAFNFPNFDRAKQALGEEFSIRDFAALLPVHKYILKPTGAIWVAEGVNAHLPNMTITITKNDGTTEDITIEPSSWIDRHNPVMQMVWDPGSPQIIDDKLLRDGGWVEKIGTRGFNLYRPPDPLPGNAAKAGPWLDHVRKLYPAEAEHILDWFAHYAQRP
jgi:hypothetical protein